MSTFYVDVAKCVFTLQELSPPHLFVQEGEAGPVVVSILSDGNYFVHNGRHRVIRAKLAGLKVIPATSLYEGDGTLPPVRAPFRTAFTTRPAAEGT